MSNDTNTQGGNDTATGEVTYTRVHQAPAELLFECMTTPEHLTHFWGPTGTSAPVEDIVVDLRPGGEFRTVMVNDSDGERYPTPRRLRRDRAPEQARVDRAGQRRPHHDHLP